MTNGTDCGHFNFNNDTPGIGRLGLGVAALEWASLGYAVLPLARGGPKPHSMLGETGGVHWASSDPERVRHWWACDPAANIGVATGQKNGIAVVDLDIKDGRDGIGEFRRFLASLGPYDIPQGMWTRTPSGGVHIWLRSAGPVPERPGILPGVDVKGDGGLVVAAPSMKLKHGLLRPGEQPGDPVPVPYVNHGCPCSLPDAPSWLPGWLASAPATGGWRPGEAEDAPDLAGLMKDGAKMSLRNRTFYRVACSRYRQLGTGPEAAERVAQELRAIWEHTDQYDFSWREVLTIMQSARKFITAAEGQDRAVTDAARAWLMDRR